MYCLVDMPEPAAVGITKVRGMLVKRMSGKLPAPAAHAAEKLKPMAAAPQGKTEAQKMGAQTKQARRKAEEDKLKQRVLDSMRANQAKEGFGKPRPQTPENLKPPTAEKQLKAQRATALMEQLNAKAKAEAAPAKPTPTAPAAGKVQKTTTGKTASTVPETAAGDWRTKFSGRSNQLDFELNKLQQSIEKLSPEQQAYWNEQISKQMGPRLASRDGTPYTEEKMNSSLVSQAKAWKDLVEWGPPTEIVDRRGQAVPAPKGMKPDVSSGAGQRKWFNPEDGLLYSGGKGTTGWRQNRAALKDTDRRLSDITEFRKNQLAKGESWPTQNLPPARTGLASKSVNEIMQTLRSSMSPSELDEIIFNGLDKSGNEGVELKRWYNANPKEKEARFREIIERWHAQGGRSGISGKPIAIPGMQPGPGEERSTIDHFTPISTNRLQKLRPEEVRRLLDNGKNFMIPEEAPNSQRQAKPWDQWLDRKEGGGAKTPKAKTPTLKGSNKGEKEKASTAPPVKKPPAAPIKKAPAASAAPQSSGVEKIQKIADDQKLENLKAQRDEYTKRWVEAGRRGNKEEAEKALALRNFVSKEYDDFKKEYDDKYNRPVARSPKELMDQEAKRVRDRIEDRISSEQTYSKEVNAQIQAAEEKKYAPFKKLSNDELASLELYGENKVKYYMDVNKFLRTGSMEGVPAERQQIVRNIVSNLNSTLNKLPASEETNFMRAVSGAGAKNLSNLKVGDVITDKGFGSYTTLGRVRTLDQFYNPNAPNAAMRVTSRNARNVAPVMPFEREEEHMLRPGTRLRVVQIIGADDPNAERSRKVGKIPTYIFEEVE
jgi:hypothetical protein